MESEKILNIGIVAHVDAGKTTLTENFLYLSGTKKDPGSVDQGSATTDNLEIEKKRGISVRSSGVSFIHNNIRINLIDTPGHVDFSAEVSRTLSILDAAILVVSAIDGIQAHTYTLFEALSELKIPVLIFLNKTDRPGSDFEKVIQDMTTELGNLPVLMNYPDKEETDEVSLINIWNETESPFKEDVIEILAENNESLMEKYLEGESISTEEILNEIKDQFNKQIITPVFCGSAKNVLGSKELLDKLSEMIETTVNSDNEISGIVYRIEHDKSLGRLAHVKLFTGSLKNRDVFYNHSQKKEMKVAQIKKVYLSKAEDLKILTAGNVAILSGMNEIQVGDILGKPDHVPKLVELNVSVLTVQVKPKNEAEYAKLAEALIELDIEDPLLEFQWFKEEKELHLKLMGHIQLEIIRARLETRFGLETEFLDPTVIYKETPASSSEGYVRYWMPKPCWAIMKFRIEPGERNSGITYKSEVSVNDIHQKYQNEVERTITKALEQGIKGWEVTDIKITLIEGEDHQVHSNPGDFIIATPMGIMNGLQNTGTTLLEPMFRYEVKASEEFLGAVAGDLTNRRAEIGNPEIIDGKFKLSGLVPVSESLKYSIRVNSLTGGKGKLKLTFAGYRECPNEVGQVREYKGVSPLDESKWILHARGAYKANEWKL